MSCLYYTRKKGENFKKTNITDVIYVQKKIILLSYMLCLMF